MNGIASADILFGGVQLIFAGEITIGAIIAFNMLSQRISQPLIALVGLINEYQQAALPVKMLGSVMNKKPEQIKSGGLTPEITVGKRRVFTCFLYPIMRAMESSFRES